ncbi:Potassium transporter 20 [Triticum urartu]|uniref:Potassium transporter n=1 Tax=Triticum urartu TaxID=4572 RepID=M8AG99_TRIUA|nr:Potassium transporter 20 [Triticum urartu]
MSVEPAEAAGETLARHDSLYGDAEKVSGDTRHGSGASWRQTVLLAFQSIGVVYGDLGTSPLYTYSGTFPDGVIRHPDDLLGVLSLILYTLILLPLLKYVFIVLYANDNGDGGTFALYSLISRYARIRMIPNQQAEDASVSNYSIPEPGSSKTKRAQWVKQRLESSKAARIALFTVTILGTSMVMGDGSLTPAISGTYSTYIQQLQVVWISVAILFMLFSVQRFGTDKVGYSFAPIILVWFVLIAGIGAYNLAAHDATVLRALNPMYIVDYFRRNGKQAWLSLGGVVLCTTGTFIIFPSVALCYMGQASYLHKFPHDVADTFYKSIPAAMFWPTFIVAILAAIIASQAMLSGAFAILSKALSLGCFPRVQVVHTSKKYAGQVYIPEVNFLIGAASIVVTLAFQTTTNIGNAYGICVVMVFSITTHLMTLVMLLVWKKNVAFIAAFYLVFGATEMLYLTSILSKFAEGGYLPFCFSLVLMALMATWHYVHEKRFIDAELERGVVYLTGEADVVAAPGSSLMKRVVVNYVYTFLRKNLSESHKALAIPKDQLLKVGITYEI